MIIFFVKSIKVNETRVSFCFLYVVRREARKTLLLYSTNRLGVKECGDRLNGSRSGLVKVTHGHYWAEKERDNGRRNVIQHEVTFMGS